MKKLREKVRTLEAQALSLQPTVAAATFRPALPRPASMAWDWHCECGYLVHAGRVHCPVCNMHRRFGATLMGSFRGQMQSSPHALVDVRRQMATLQVYSELPAARGRPRGASAQRGLKHNVMRQPLRLGP